MCNRHRKLWRTDKCYILGIFEREAGHHLGHVDLTVIERGDRDWGNLGYAVHNNVQGRGIATEAGRMAIQWAFKALRLNRLEVVVDLDNLPSLAVARKLGLEPEGVRRRFAREGDVWLDQKVFVAVHRLWTGSASLPRDVQSLSQH